MQALRRRGGEEVMPVKLWSVRMMTRVTASTSVIEVVTTSSSRRALSLGDSGCSLFYIVLYICL